MHPLSLGSREYPQVLDALPTYVMLYLFALSGFSGAVNLRSIRPGASEDASVRSHSVPDLEVFWPTGLDWLSLDPRKSLAP